MVYLGGTIHLLRKSDFPLPAEFDQAYQKSDSLVFETDIRSLSSAELQREFITELSYKDSRTVKSEISPSLYEKLKIQFLYE